MLFGKAVEGRDVPRLRGEITIDATPWEVMAVISDVEAHTDWMHGCGESRILRAESDTVRFVYNRTDAPWPLADRDVVLRTEFSVAKHGELRLVSRTTDELDVPSENGAVRMPSLEVTYRLREREGRRTRVLYELDIDLGGALPSWLVRGVSREILLHTLTNLRERVDGTRGEYEAWLARWDPTRGSVAAAALERD